MSLQQPVPTAGGAPNGAASNGVPSTGWQPRGSEPRTGTVPVAVPQPMPAAAQGERLPRPPRRRNGGLAALAVLLVAGSAAVAGLLAIRLDDRTNMLVARVDIPAGVRITEDMLAVDKIGGGHNLIPEADKASVVGTYAAIPIPATRLIDRGMLSASSALRAGTVAVGVVLGAGQAPAGGLQSGDRVTVYNTDAAGTVITDAAVVSSVKAPAVSSFGASTGGQTVATLIVPAAVAPQLAAANAAGKISLGLTARGVPIGQAG